MDGLDKTTDQKASTDQADAQLNGAEAILKILEEEGVEVIFGYPGGAVLPIYDACSKAMPFAIFWCGMNKRLFTRRKAMLVPRVKRALCW
jgi:hypothetical protein